jgi:hypothetical protein
MRYLKLTTICGLFLLAVSLSASAGSVDSFNNAALTGVSNGGNVSGTFSFDSHTDQFANISVSFVSSVFGNINASDPGPMWGTYSNGKWSFQWQTWKGLDLITYSITYNPATNQFTAGGSIKDIWGDKGNFNYSVPEGGTPLSYLVLSALAMLIGILMSGKQSRSIHTAQSS